MVDNEIDYTAKWYMKASNTSFTLKASNDIIALQVYSTINKTKLFNFSV